MILRLVVSHGIKLGTSPDTDGLTSRVVTQLGERSRSLASVTREVQRTKHRVIDRGISERLDPPDLLVGPRGVGAVSRLSVGPHEERRPLLGQACDEVSMELCGIALLPPWSSHRELDHCEGAARPLGRDVVRQRLERAVPPLRVRGELVSIVPASALEEMAARTVASGSTVDAAEWTTRARGVGR